MRVHISVTYPVTEMFVRYLANYLCILKRGMLVLGVVPKGAGVTKETDPIVSHGYIPHPGGGYG